MAKLSSDGKYVTVERGDCLTQIAVDYAGGYSKYKDLARINNISNPNLIYVGQKIYLTDSGSSSSGSTTSTSTNSNKPAINQFGEISDNEGNLFVTWTWSKSNTASYKVLWTYDTGDGVWFGSPSTISVDDDAPNQAKQSTFSIPSNAKRIQFKVKPISKKKKSGDTEVSYWEADWSDVKTWTDETPLKTPGVPDVTIDKYKLTATLDGINTDGTHIQFQIVKNNAPTAFNTSGKVEIVTTHASYACNVDAGAEYKVRCRACKGSQYSEWSAYSSNVATIPATPSGITVLRASSETSVYLEWEKVDTATSYDLEYTTKKEYFDGSDQTTPVNGIEFTHYEKTGLESGQEYFFRVRATSAKGSSSWSEPKAIVIGKKPAAPTTWSSTTTAITGEDLILYWVHNSEDGSSQTYAELELTINGVPQLPSITIQNTRPDDEKDKTSSYKFDTSSYVEGTKLQWRVRTAGITKTYGDWSIERTVDIYAPPTLELTITDANANPVDTLRKFPCYVKALAGPKTQVPIGYQLVVTSEEMYDTTDNIGNPMTVKAGDQVYSKYFDTIEQLLVELSASNIDLQNGVRYTVTCEVTMNSGLTAEASDTFIVAWEDAEYSPNAEIGIDQDTLVATIRPYCSDGRQVAYKVNVSNGVYTKSSVSLDSVWGEPVLGVRTTTGELVYNGVTSSNSDVYFCYVEESTPVTNVLLSVYRREFDGRFTELAVNLDGAKATTVTDPHPALDYARYRIVAISKDTGSVSFYDPPGYPVGGKSVIIQWDEEWSNFEATSEDALVKPPWAGSLLKLPYNIDVSDNVKPDIQLVEYIGRQHPVSYYGTQLGQSATWNVEIESDDEETLYGLRRLAIWMGDAYVREPSGSGYWANVKVSFNQKHCAVTIPITLDIARVEGGA